MLTVPSCPPGHAIHPRAPWWLATLLLLSVAVRAASPLDINAADAATLAAELPGVGPVKARDIVAHRAAHGPFADVDALLAVKGIGPATLARIRERLAGTTNGPPADGSTRSGRAAGDTSPSRRDPPPLSSAERETRAAVRRLVARALADAREARASPPRRAPSGER